MVSVVAAVAACQRSRAEPQQRAEPVTANAAAATPAAAPPAPPATEGSLLPVGAALPAVSGVAHNGEKVSIPDLKGKPVVVYFYPKDDTPGCTVEAQEIRDLWNDIRGTSATVIGVSTDDAESHRAFAEKHALPFLLLPDADHAIARAFGVPLNNGRAARVTFVFGRDGKLASVFPDVNPRGHASELVATLRGLGSE
jgi:peroxiredoxin Q/BCP